MRNELLSHEFFMKKAYNQALLAYEIGEVPVGAVLVDGDNNIIAEGFNQTITLKDPTAHAETLVLRDAAKRLDNYRLLNTKLYVTLEPCIMCIGALIQARVGNLFFGCNDSRVGILSKEKLHKNKDINHNLNVVGGIMSQQCGELLKNFFRERRK
ncbi:tRNA adenosine(34) deaminase TadA [Francisella sp. Scap27]|uniref:tRNA adenosine(34) deaminase TadA n=1 Tax=Francisella sp. Scap27 TaxID=2589986 RepID=UPI00211864F0|nr:tRNA adenosine(34) deaminase TadA [Francisella sp. Scap27]